MIRAPVVQRKRFTDFTLLPFVWLFSGKLLEKEKENMQYKNTSTQKTETATQWQRKKRREKASQHNIIM